jgi:NAD(P)-dependent dehydrogenase (short-subunit alcohol dehydrogenase family)
MEIAGRIAIVTGGAHRVGRGIALALAGAGADVFVHYHRSGGPAERTADDITRLGRRAVVGSADLADPAAAADLVAAAVDALGRPTILVNSASGFPADTLEDVTREAWQRTLDVTLSGPVFLTQAFAAALTEDDEAAVVNITDVKTTTPYRRHFSYTIAKGGIDTFTRAAALALAPRVRVNAVALGVVLPPQTEEAEYAERLAADLPLERVGGVAPVADAVVALIRNDFITGEIVRLDGGGHLR